MYCLSIFASSHKKAKENVNMESTELLSAEHRISMQSTKSAGGPQL